MSKSTTSIPSPFSPDTNTWYVRYTRDERTDIFQLTLERPHPQRPQSKLLDRDHALTHYVRAKLESLGKSFDDFGDCNRVIIGELVLTPTLDPVTFELATNE